MALAGLHFVGAAFASGPFPPDTVRRYIVRSPCANQLTITIGNYLVVAMLCIGCSRSVAHAYVFMCMCMGCAVVSMLDLLPASNQPRSALAVLLASDAMSLSLVIKYNHKHNKSNILMINCSNSITCIHVRVRPCAGDRSCFSSRCLRTKHS